ncbi:hypothetical protein [Tenacibaculum phage JQ]|nr:hypothetical protein [Tenacibaculum phage JQ]
MKIFDKIVEFQQQITPKPDKLAHFFWGFWYSLFGYVIYMLTDVNLYIFFVPLCLGMANEIRNYFGKGTPELWDVFFTILPSLALIFI